MKCTKSFFLYIMIKIKLFKTFLPLITFLDFKMPMSQKVMIRNWLWTSQIVISLIIYLTVKQLKMFEFIEKPLKTTHKNNFFVPLVWNLHRFFKYKWNWFITFFRINYYWMKNMERIILKKLYYIAISIAPCSINTILNPKNLIKIGLL